MTPPSLSIIIPVLNEEKYLPTLLTDLSRQTYTDFEVIVVDGQSKDRTVEKANHFAHRLPKLTILNSEIRNVCCQRNQGVTSAASDLILFMDADNRVPTYFLQGLKYRVDLTDPDIFTTWIAAEANTSNSVAIATIINLYFDLQKRTDNPPTIEAMLGFKKEVFKKLKGFNPKLAINEGNDIVKKAIKKGFHFELYQDPTYSFSLRRLQKQGTLRMIGTVSQLEINRLLGRKLSNQKISQLYPMQGGGYYDNLIQKLKLPKQKEKLVKFVRSFLFDEKI
ncbi:glycosyltransferase [Candidatus Collierbacteria bacterium]|nr:glycosyltransferase [Candidatus Collierbacteria bacterium]